MRLPPTRCRVCFRPCVFNKFSQFWQKYLNYNFANVRCFHPLAQNMALSDAQASALLVLLEAPSKQAVDAFFCSCFRERQRHAAGPIDDARVAEIVESLGLSTPLTAAPLQRAAIALIGNVLYADASAEQTAALFPPDFHSSLQALLTKVVPSRWLTRRPRCGSATRPPLSQPWARLLPLLLLGILPSP